MRHNSRCCSLIHCFSRVNHCSASRTPLDCAMSPIVATPLVTGFVAIYIEFSAWARIDRDIGCWILDVGCWFDALCSSLAGITATLIELFTAVRLVLRPQILPM